MKDKIIQVINDMSEDLTILQLKKLQEVLLKRFWENEEQPQPAQNEE